MKCLHHEQSPTLYRVQQRGKRFYVQANAGTKGTREADPWEDRGPAHDAFDAAKASMYLRWPITGAR